jgi:hypothetical protein
MSFDIYGNYIVNEKFTPDPPKFTTNPPKCTDNPLFQCSKFADTYLKCYSADYNYKHLQCCETCKKTLPCKDDADADVCQAMVQKGFCNDPKEKKNTWESCCKSCSSKSKSVYTPFVTPTDTPGLSKLNSLYNLISRSNKYCPVCKPCNCE